LREVREFIHFDDVGYDVFVCNRHFMCQPGYGWAVRSSRSDKDLDVQILIDRLQRFDRRLR
jgi:hypothetical protein